MAPRRPTSTGRKKIEIKRIESEEARQVCFSKRRKGLFKKLNELSIMCGSKVAAVVFSPGGKAFSFGHPSVDSVLDRFCTSNSSEAAVDAGDSDGEGDRSLALEELNREDRELCAQLAAIKARNEAVDEYFAKARADGCQVAAWLDQVTDVSQMSDEDLAAFQAALEKVGADVAARCNQVLQEALLFGRPVQGGGGEFELGGTSASGGMEMAQQQQVMMLEDMPPPPPPTGFAAGTEMMQQHMMLEMPPPPPRTGFAARTEMVQQQMMMLKMPPTGFAGTEMMQQQQQMMMNGHAHHGGGGGAPPAGFPPMGYGYGRPPMPYPMAYPMQPHPHADPYNYFSDENPNSCSVM